MSTIYDLHQKLVNKEVSSVELTKQYLANIKKKEPELNAFITICEKEALAQAEEADKLIAADDYSVLTGIPYTVKDNFCTKNIRTTASSKILESYIPSYNATVINRLNGAILLGKANMEEFAMGASGEKSFFGPTKNPHDLKHVPGGTSSGSAVAVSADEAVFSLGTDTGGSVRQPASFCGVVGLRPTYGRISRYGVIALASSIDAVGILSKDVRDSALVLQSLAGKDNFDSTSSRQPVPEYIKELEQDIKGMRIGIPKEYFEVEGLDKKVAATIKDIIQKIEAAGAVIEEVSLPYTKYAIPVYYVMVPAEASSNLARYDGIKYGFKAHDAEDLLAVYLQSRGQGFGDEPKRRIMIGTYVLSAGYYEAFYQQAARVRTLICEDFKSVFSKVDCLITPTTPTPAFTFGAKEDPLSMYLADILTAPASCAGVPALSIPCGNINNLPIGLQIIGNYWEESKIYQLARSIEKVLF